MSKLKKVLFMCTAYVLVAALAIGGTIAYLQDTDSDVNVMTLGNVQIEQHEYERAQNADGSYKTATIDNQNSYVLQGFTQAKPLYPSVGDPNGGYDSTRVRMSQVDSYGTADVHKVKNAQDKFVTIENTGKTDAYVRTIIAFEIGSVAADDFHSLIQPVQFMTEGNGVWAKTNIGVAEIDGNNYYLAEYIYKGAGHLGGVHNNGILPAGDTTYPSLCQVYITAKATNEDCVALDGNGNGTYDIMVLSQAVQAAGFADAQTALNTAFGDVTAATAAEWFGGDDFKAPIVVANAEQLQAALTNGEPVILANDITLDAAFAVDQVANIDLNGKTLTTMGLELKQGGQIADGTVTSGGNTNMVPHLKVSGGNVELNNVVVDVKHHLNANVYWSEATGLEIMNATAVLNNCDVKIHNGTKAQWVYSYGISINNANVTVNGGSITATCINGTAANGPTNPNAVSAMGESEITLQNVAVTATYYATTVNGHLTINTTDKNITGANIVDNRGGSHTVNYID